MANEPKKPQDAPPPESAKGEKFYDAKFSIEALQHEPYESGFTWRSVIGAFFIAFVMLPGIIFMGLMIGQDLGTAADWFTIILFGLERLARRLDEIQVLMLNHVLRRRGRLTTTIGTAG